jgi:hypothetical protein
MKYIALIILTLPFASCETIENEDGTRTTRFDAKAAAAFGDLGMKAYDQYRIVGYDQFGNPIYRQ